MTLTSDTYQSTDSPRPQFPCKLFLSVKREKLPQDQNISARLIFFSLSPWIICNKSLSFQIFESECWHMYVRKKKFP